MSEPTRPIRQPTVDTDGSLVAHSVATPKAFKVRAKVTVGSRKVIPVIFVPGIMGSNLRIRREKKRAPAKGAGANAPHGSAGDSSGPREHPNGDFLDQSDELSPGAPSWRPPNGMIDGLVEAARWKRRSASMRQRLLNGIDLEVDETGDLGDEAAGLTHAEMRARGWGEVHLDSYGETLEKLQSHLDTTFRVNKLGEREVRVHWKRVMQCEPSSWGVRKINRVTVPELEKFAQFQYPVYAVGYNWLESCAVSAQRLSARIDEIKRFWRSRKHECDRVILVTHSMGGLVARACARMRSVSADDPADIAGIIHGVIPAFGAPVAYRRIACGTEGERYSNGLVDNIKANRFVEIAGTTPEETTAVMATAPGVLELLPNHLYPKSWLTVHTLSRLNNEEKEQKVLSLPTGNPYDMYRDMESWYRVINPFLADPAGLYKKVPGGVIAKIHAAISRAEDLHKRILCVAPDDKNAKEARPYFHPHTFAFYGDDDERRTYGSMQWAARLPSGQGVVVTAGNMRDAQPHAHTPDGAREVLLEGRIKLRLAPWGQDTPGDDTVPRYSGSGIGPYVREVYAARGFGHQDCFKHDAMLLLTRHLIVKIVQGIK